MDETIVGDDVRHREDPAVPLLGQHVAARTGQRPARGDELVVYAVHPPHHRAGAGQVEFRFRGAGENAPLRARGHQLADGSRVQLHIGVQVDARERDAGGVAPPQGVRLARRRRLDDPHAVDGSRRRRGAVRTGVGHHDDVELAGLAAAEQAAQIARDDRFLVVRRYDDADGGRAHVGKITRCRAEASR